VQYSIVNTKDSKELVDWATAEISMLKSDLMGLKQKNSESDAAIQMLTHTVKFLSA